MAIAILKQLDVREFAADTAAATYKAGYLLYLGCARSGRPLPRSFTGHVALSLLGSIHPCFPIF